jgi:hypothetical protein
VALLIDKVIALRNLEAEPRQDGVPWRVWAVQPGFLEVPTAV